MRVWSVMSGYQRIIREPAGLPLLDELKRGSARGDYGSPFDTEPYDPEITAMLDEDPDAEEFLFDGDDRPETFTLEPIGMNDAPPYEDDKPKSGPLVEDTQTVGGRDKKTGAPVVRPKTPEGKADKMTEATDPRERSDPEKE